MKIRYKNCLVIGNGFDLDLGLPSSYSAFLRSKEWRKICETCNPEGLIDFVNKKNIMENWCDLETLLLEYAKEFPKSKTMTDNIYNEYNDIKNAMCLYLRRIVDHTEPRDSSFAKKFIKKYLMEDHINPIFTFNYTPLDSYSNYFGTIHSPNVTYIHGRLENQNVIFGIECDDFDSIDSRLSFMIKTNSSNYFSNKLQNGMLSSENVYIFGHSLGNIDKNYFISFLQSSAKGTTPRNITFVTKNMESDIVLRDNIRRMGISLIHLFQYNNLRILHTEELENDDIKTYKILDEV